MTVEVPFHPLTEGLKDDYVEVIDFDASNDCFYDPVDLNNPSVMLQSGLTPSESDPRFHQQMVYAVARRTIEIFKFALGRDIKWNFARAKMPDGSLDRSRLRIYPHGMQQANAYFSRSLGALVFGYFPAAEDDPGTNLPGQTIFTCLSHDIIAHETTHALVDDQRRYFMVPTNRDTLAFHEAFADIVALFQHFTLDEVLLDVIVKTGGRIFQPAFKSTVWGSETPLVFGELEYANPLVDLARQFGEAMGKRAALRSALGVKPDQNALKKLQEPHERGAILVAAVFDAFFSVYMRKVEDLLQISRDLNPNRIHPDIAKRLAADASKIAQSFLNICIRSLDYCPPVDITFGDFLRAMITADFDLVREDPHGYRAALIDSFRLRGIQPKGVISYAEESLRWTPAPTSEAAITLTRADLELLLSDATNDSAKAKLLHNFAIENASALGLDSKKPRTTSIDGFHPIHRVGPDGRINREFVVQIVQRSEELIDPDDPTLGSLTFLGGATIVIVPSDTNGGIVRYAICKPMLGKDADNRLLRQRDFSTNAAFRLGTNVYAESAELDAPARIGAPEVNFAAMHRGY